MQDHTELARSLSSMSHRSILGKEERGLCGLTDIRYSLCVIISFHSCLFSSVLEVLTCVLVDCCPPSLVCVCVVVVPDVVDVLLYCDAVFGSSPSCDITRGSIYTTTTSAHRAIQRRHSRCKTREAVGSHGTTHQSLPCQCQVLLPRPPTPGLPRVRAQADHTVRVRPL